MGSIISLLKNKIAEYIKFNIIGTSNFVISQGIYIFLHIVIHLHYVIAYSITTIFSVTVSYYFNSKYTFKQNTYSAYKFLSSILIYVFEYLLNLSIIIFLVNVFKLGTIIPPLIAPVFSTPIVFLLMRKVIKGNSYVVESKINLKENFMTIRDAIDSDIDDIAKLYILNWKETYKGLLPDTFLDGLTEDYAVKTWSKYLKERENHVFVAYEENKFLGFIACKKDDEEDNCLYLDSLHITKDSRGKGIGTHLIYKVGEYALKYGYKCMTICVVKGNDNAKRIYERLGAVHYKDFIDDFGNTKSNSEKLIWKDLSILSNK